MIGFHIKKIRKEKKMSQQSFADKLSTSSGHISDIENGKKIPGGSFFISLKREFNVNINWILTGQGSPYIIGEDGKLDADPEVNELLDMTRAVIKSDTGYARSLKANIRSFHDAVETQSRLDKLEQRIMEKDRSGNENGGCPPGASPAPKIQSDRGRKTGT